MQTYCPSCAIEVAPDARACAACGANFTARNGWRPTTERPVPSPSFEQELQEVVKHRIQFRKLARSLFVNDKKWSWQATLIWALAAAWYGWLFSPLVVYRVVGVPELADLRVIEGRLRMEGPYTVYSSRLPPPRYYIDNESGSTRLHCAPLPHPKGCYAISYACYGTSSNATVWFDRYFGILQIRCIKRDGDEAFFPYDSSVELDVLKQLGRDGKGAVIIFPILLFIYARQVVRVYRGSVEADASRT